MNFNTWNTLLAKTTKALNYCQDESYWRENSSQLKSPPNAPVKKNWGASWKES